MLFFRSLIGEKGAGVGGRSASGDEVLFGLFGSLLRGAGGLSFVSPLLLASGGGWGGKMGALRVFCYDLSLVTGGR